MDYGIISKLKEEYKQSMIEYILENKDSAKDVIFTGNQYENVVIDVIDGHDIYCKVNIWNKLPFKIEQLDLSQLESICMGIYINKF